MVSMLVSDIVTYEHSGIFHASRKRQALVPRTDGDRTQHAFFCLFQLGG